MRAVTFCGAVVPVCTAAVFSNEDVVQPETRSMQKRPAMRSNFSGFLRMISDLPCVRYRYFPGGILVLCFRFSREIVLRTLRKRAGVPTP